MLGNIQVIMKAYISLCAMWHYIATMLSLLKDGLSDLNYC